MKRIVALIVLVAATTTGAVAIGSPASAARETCEYYTWIHNNGGYESHVPIGPTTLDCGLLWGDSGPGVSALQETLNDCYLAPAHKTLLVEDASFGRKTYNALLYAQGVAGTPADGQYGPKTRRAFKWTGGTGGYSTCHKLPN